jgi:hypothetical protein
MMTIKNVIKMMIEVIMVSIMLTKGRDCFVDDRRDDDFNNDVVDVMMMVMMFLYENNNNNLGEGDVNYNLIISM